MSDLPLTSGTRDWTLDLSIEENNIIFIVIN